MQSSIEDGTLCEQVSQLEAFNCSTSYLASIKLHLRCLIAFYSKLASLSDIMKILVIINVNLIQGFWLYLKIPFFVKIKVKLGQENWWTKLTNNTVIDSLYNFQNKIGLLSQLKLHCIGCSYFAFVSWFSFSRSETSSIVKKCGVKILGRTVASKCLCAFLFSIK